MTKKTKNILYCILIIGFISGYCVGTIVSKESEERPKTAYEIMQEGYNRINE